MKYRVSAKDAGARLDNYLAAKLPNLSRALIKRFIDDGSVTVSKTHTKAGYKVKAKDSINIDVDIDNIDTIPDIELPIIYEDDNVIVVDKPVGVISHSRSRYWNEPSVASFVRQKTTQEGERAGIVHRLDRATSGVMICAKNAETMKWLQKQFQDRKVKKTYEAVVQGKLSPLAATIDLSIERNPKKPQTFRVGAQGKAAVTDYNVLEESETTSLVELKPKTGRTHQLRVHLAYIKHPIIGDTLYDGKPAERMLLHAKALELTLPSGERKTFSVKTPKEFHGAIHDR